MSCGKVNEAYPVKFTVRNGDGSPRTGLVAGNFTVTVTDPDDSATANPAVSEIGNGQYVFTIAAAFTLTNGAGNYGFNIELTLVPLDTGGGTIKFTLNGLDDLAVPGDEMALIDNAITALKIATDAIDSDAIAADAIGALELATSAVNEIRDAILADSTPFNGADIGTILGDTNDIQTRLPAVLVGGRMDSDVGNIQPGQVDAAAIATNAIDADALAADAVAEIADGVWDELASDHIAAGSMGLLQGLHDDPLEVNVTQISGSTVAATNLREGAEALVRGTVDDTAFPPTTTKFETDITEAVADRFVRRSITFDPSSSIPGQGAFIDSYSLVGGRGFFTVSLDGDGDQPMTTAPADGDTFVIA